MSLYIGFFFIYLDLNYTVLSIYLSIYPWTNRETVFSSEPLSTDLWWERCDKRQRGRVKACATYVNHTSPAPLLQSDEQHGLHCSDLAKNNFEDVSRSDKNQTAQTNHVL